MGRKLLGLAALAGAFVLARLERDRRDVDAVKALVALSEEAEFLERLRRSMSDALGYCSAPAEVLSVGLFAVGVDGRGHGTDPVVCMAVVEGPMYRYAVSVWRRDGDLGYAIAGMGDAMGFSLSKPGIRRSEEVLPTGYGGKVRRAPSELVAEALSVRAGMPHPGFAPRAAGTSPSGAHP